MHSHASQSTLSRLRQRRWREVATVVALSAAFLFVGAVALGILV